MATSSMLTRNGALTRTAPTNVHTNMITMSSNLGKPDVLNIKDGWSQNGPVPENALPPSGGETTLTWRGTGGLLRVKLTSKHNLLENATQKTTKRPILGMF